MTNLLIVLTLGPQIAEGYRAGLQKAFPDLHIDVVDHHTKADPYIEKADIIFCFLPMITDELVKKGKNLKWIQTFGTGVDGYERLIDGRKILISAVRGLHGAPVSEGAMMLMLGLARDVPRVVHSRDFGKWDRWPAHLLSEKKVGILGVGNIGEWMGRICKGFNMDVVGISSRPLLPNFDEMRPKENLSAVVGDLDFLVVLAPLTNESRHSVNADVFKAMKKSAFLVNVARGELIDEPALIKALDDGEIAGAGLDVFAKEPLPEGNPLWTHPKVIMTAHTSGMFHGYVDKALPTLIHNLRHFLAGEIKQMKHVDNA